MNDKRAIFRQTTTRGEQEQEQKEKEKSNNEGKGKDKGKFEDKKERKPIKYDLVLYKGTWDDDEDLSIEAQIAKEVAGIKKPAAEKRIRAYEPLFPQCTLAWNISPYFCHSMRFSRTVAAAT